MSEIERRIRSGTDQRATQKFEHLSEKSLGELQSDLDSLLDDRPDMDFDSEELSALLDALEEKEPMIIDDNTEESLRLFHERHALLFEQTAARVPASRAKKGILHRPGILRPIVVTAIITMLLSLSVSFAFGSSISAVLKHTAEAFGFRSRDSVYPDKQDINGQSELFKDLLVMLKTYEITVPVAPAWMPEGFELESLQIDHSLYWKTICTLYRDNEKLLTLQYAISIDPLSDYETDGQKTIEFYAGGVEHYITTNMDLIVAAWVNKNVECLIFGNISLEEMKKMINSIYER